MLCNPATVNTEEDPHRLLHGDVANMNLQVVTTTYESQVLMLIVWNTDFQKLLLAPAAYTLSCLALRLYQEQSQKFLITPHREVVRVDGGCKKPETCCGQGFKFWRLSVVRFRQKIKK